MAGDGERGRRRKITVVDQRGRRKVFVKTNNAHKEETTQAARLEDRPRPTASRTCISAAKALTGVKSEVENGEEIFKAAAEL